MLGISLLFYSYYLTDMIHILTDKLWFPPVEDALDDGLLAVGGDLSPQRLLLAYSKGIFPWFNEDEPPLWWSPDPRCVLYPEKLKVSKSMKQVLRSNTFSFTINSAFKEVITNCATTERKDQDGTWITNQVIEAYYTLHLKGHAHAAECWHNGQLVGGLYGILLGKTFFGESMFSHVSNASKFAFIHWVKHLQTLGVNIIDCQIHTDHLESLGAEMIPRAEFISSISKNML